jgi:hypothetical protein
MKTNHWTKTIGVLLLSLGLFKPASGFAQTLSIQSGSSINVAQPTQPDSLVQVAAESQGLAQIAPEDLPIIGGTFWWVMPGGNAVPAPCPPLDLSGAVYQIADGQFLVDETGGQVVVNTHRFGLQAQSTSSVASEVASQANAVVNLITQIQATAANQQMQAMAGTMMAMNVPMPGDGGGDGTNNYYTPDYSSYNTVDYGSNLWVAGISASSGNLNGTATNTQSGIQYDIMSRTNLLQTDWQYEGSILGSDATNWTSLSVAQNGRPSLFLRLRSNAGDGSGLPSWWEQQYGLSGVDPNALDFAGDGWSIWQDYVAGYSPLAFRTPPTPQGLTAIYNGNSTATVSWRPSLGPVTGYTIQRDYYTFDVPPYDQSQTFNVSASTATIQDNTPFTNAYYLGGDWGLSVHVSYKIQAHYAGGDSAWSDPVWLALSSPDISLAAGPQGSVYLAARNLPAKTTALRLTRLDEWMEEEFGDSPADAVSFDIPLSTGTNGLYPIPSNETTSPLDSYGYAFYEWSVQPVDATGQGTGAAVPFFGNSYTGWWSDVAGDSINWIVPPYFDGRAQLKQNLIFKLRAATKDFPFTFTHVQGSDRTAFLFSSNYVSASFFQEPENYYGYIIHPVVGFGFLNDDFDFLWPFWENTSFRNFVYSLADAGPSTNYVPYGLGHLTTGVSGNYDGYYNPPFNFTPLLLTEPATYQFQLTTSNGGTIPALLPGNQTRWLGSYPMDSPEMYYDPGSDSMVSYGYLEEIGVTPSVQTDWQTYYNTFETMAAHSRNYWGLTNLSALIAYDDGSGQAIATTTLSAGNQVENVDGYFYPETAQPQFQTVGYNFWAYSPFPESTNFSVTQPSDALVVGVNSSLNIAGYAKLAVQNGYPGVYAYLGQYFDQAYQINTNGIVTTNTTGMLSPYGQFFATQPGPAALVTMPDIDTGQRGTGIVSCISVNLNASHSGGMDLSFNGPDATSARSPYFMWANNNYDRWTPDADDGTNYMDDVLVQGCPLTPNTTTPDCNYRDMYGNRVIPCTRDLEDYARLWVCGITTNLLAALPTGSTITLNWGDVGNPNSGNPTIDLFQATDPDGGIEYLTNKTSAATQINPVYSAYVGRVGPGQSIQLNSSYFSGWAGNHFIWCGVSNGTGGLNLTITDGNGNTLAQSTAYIQIVDIKQMYERWTVGDNPTNAPSNTAIPVTDGLPAGMLAFEYTPPTDTNTPYILFVHGWNMEPWEKDRFAETAFKRLYWQGYQGRFGEFRWPTSWGFTGDFSQLVTNPQEKDNYDNSENFAWQSAVGLLNKLEDLSLQYPGHVYVLAHSMGNIVAGEALTLAGNNQLVNTYVASQAAVTAHIYDNTVPNYSFNVVIGGIQFNMGPHTPNIYGDWFAGDYGGGAVKIVSFYNVNDYALSRLHWQLDQLFKPDILVAEGNALWNYGYSGSPSDPSPWNNFFKTNDYTGARVNFDIVNSPTNRDEVMAYAAQAYTTALGATPGVHHVTANVDLTTLWPSPDPLDNNYASHFFHSAEFRGDTVWEWNYWNTLLFSQTAGFNINRP